MQNPDDRCRCCKLISPVPAETGQFVPTNANGTIDVADETYLSFGWWLNEMADGDVHMTEVFASCLTGYG